MNRNSSEATSFEIAWNYMNVPAWASYAHVVYLCILFVVALPGNTLIIMVQFKNSHKTATDNYVMTIAMFDLACALVNIPFHGIRDFKIVWERLSSSFLCRFGAFVGYMSVLSSTSLLAAVAIEQFLKICKPLWIFPRCETGKRRSIAIGACSVLFATPPFVFFRLGSNGLCQLTTGLQEAMLSYNKLAVISVITAFCFISLAYISIVVTLRKRHHQRVHVEQIKRLHVGVSGSSENPQVLEGSASKEAINEPSTEDNLRITSEITPCSSTSKQTENVTGTLFNDAEYSRSLNEKKAKDTIGPTKAKSYQTTSSDGLPRRLVVERLSITRTSRIMFLITLIYMITYGWSAAIVASGFTLFGTLVQFWARSIVLINCATNPILFYGMNSTFRKEVKKVICKPLH